MNRMSNFIKYELIASICAVVVSIFAGDFYDIYFSIILGFILLEVTHD